MLLFLRSDNWQKISPVLLLVVYNFAETTETLCLNGGIAVFTSSGKAEFRCECPSNFVGSFCEYSTKLLRSTIDDGSPPGKGFEGTFINVLLCIFFLLLLPTLILYCIRTLYLFLKRCYHYQPQGTIVTETSRIMNPQLRRAPTEILVQLPSSFCRPIHTTCSVPVHSTASLSLTEFNELLTNIQRELDNNRRQHSASHMQGLNFLDLPPSYESIQ